MGTHAKLAILRADINNFSWINANLGHRAGDELLIDIATRLQRKLPRGCTAARFSGDEFVIVCDNYELVGGLDALARESLALLTPALSLSGRSVKVNASVGIATATTDDMGALELLRFAEIAMQDAKLEARSGAASIATRSVVDIASREFELELDLWNALSEELLELRFRPVVSSGGTVEMVEAIAYWPRMSGAELSGDEVMAITQRSGTAQDLGLWILRTAAAEAAVWPSLPGGRPALCVDATAILAGNGDFAEVVRQVATSASLNPGRLVLQVHETYLAKIAEREASSMNELIAEGVRFSIKNFGVGFSSLAWSKKHPVQIIQIAAEFGVDVDNDPATLAVARAIAGLANLMGWVVIADGVSSRDQQAALRRVGVDLFQGSLWGSRSAAELKIQLAEEGARTRSIGMDGGGRD